MPKVSMILWMRSVLPPSTIRRRDLPIPSGVPAGAETGEPTAHLETPSQEDPARRRSRRSGGFFHLRSIVGSAIAARARCQHGHGRSECSCPLDGAGRQRPPLNGFAR